jgi:ubiquinone biosynthesis protein Coq4
MFDRIRAVAAGYRLFKDPTRIDEFLEMVTRLTKDGRADPVADAVMRSSPLAARACEERRLMKVDPDELAACPPGSLGRAVHEHCVANGIHPSTFPRRPNRTPAEFVLAHIENTHDVWHPVTAFAADVAGEVGLQAFYLAQFPNTIGLLIRGLAPIQAATRDLAGYPRLFEEMTRGWLLGKRASGLFGYPWDEHWNRPLADVRRELGIDLEAVAAAMGPGTETMIERLRTPADFPPMFGLSA